MAFLLAKDKFDGFLSMLAKEYDLYAPKEMAGKGPFAGTGLVGYGRVTSLKEIIFDRKTIYSPKEVLLPINETLFYFTEEKYTVPETSGRPAIIFLRPCDTHAVKRLDQIYLGSGPHQDPYYQKRREKTKFFVLECTGFPSCFCVSMGTNRADDYAIFLGIRENGVLCDCREEEFTTDLASLGEKVSSVPSFIEQNQMAVDLPGQISPDVYEQAMWQEYDRRCIACGRCNVCCPTCTCFSMQDIFYGDNQSCGERRRVWAGCMIDGFSDLAGGHAFRSHCGERMRFKALHKIYDFKKRFGCHMCVGCGRCDDICPEYISFSHLINRLAGGESYE